MFMNLKLLSQYSRHSGILQLVTVEVIRVAYFIPRTGLDWTHGLSWKQLLNNNPGIIHLLQHWRHHYRATTVLLLALPYKS